MRSKLLGFFRRFAGDEAGVVMTEYVIMLTYLVVGVIWLNKVTDTILFGQSPYIQPNNPDARAGNFIPPDELFGDVGPESGEFDFERDVMKKIAGDSPTVESQHPDRAYLSQIYIHLSRP